KAIRLSLAFMRTLALALTRSHKRATERQTARMVGLTTPLRVAAGRASEAHRPATKQAPSNGIPLSLSRRRRGKFNDAAGERQMFKKIYLTAAACAALISNAAHADFA